MFVDRPWNKVSLLRLGSSLLVCFGVSSLVPLLLSAWIGSSFFSTADLKEPDRIAHALVSQTSSNSPLVTKLAALASPEDRETLRRTSIRTPISETNPAVQVLTNLLNRALLDPGLRSREALQGLSLSESTTRLLSEPATEGSRLRLNRMILQDAFPKALQPIRHSKELPSTQAKSYLFMSANLALQIGFFWILATFLRDEGLTWSQFLRGSAPAPLRSVGFGIGMGVGSTLILLMVSALSTWIWTHLDHTPQLQQPLQIFQQAAGMPEKLFFAYLAIVGAPFFEEVFFRGLLYTALRQFGYRRVAWILSAVIFGLIHLDKEKFLPLTVFGLILVAVYEHTRTLIAPILTHATFNLINLTLFLTQDAIRNLLKQHPVTTP